MLNSEEVWNHQHWSVALAANVIRNVSSSRKMLKFLQFMECLKKSYLFQIDKAKKSLTFKVVGQTRILSSFFLYLMDNIVWLSNIGLISQNVIDGYSLPWIGTWTGIKDIFALIKNVSGLVQSIFNLLRRSKTLKSLEANLN
jgi:hypothetical protein